MKILKKNYWFKAKLYGWGWTPATWQGWLITIGYVALLTVFLGSVDENSAMKEVVFMAVIPSILLTTTFIRIAYKKGEKPKWRWGNSE